MSLVLDCSAALAWFFEDEQTDAIKDLLQRVAGGGAVVPSLWRLEVANGLQTAVCRGRITTVHRDAPPADLGVLSIVVDAETDRYAWSTTLELADRFRLTAYAAYLELASRRRLPLASLDQPLRTAANALSVLLIGKAA